MTRPTHINIDTNALLLNVKRVRQCAPRQQIIAMVKANAYGCGLAAILPTLMGNVDAVGVACLEEAIAVRNLGFRDPCILFQGIFSREEWILVVNYNLECVIHQPQQLQWLLATPLNMPVTVWVKVDTGMHRLGFAASEVAAVVASLRDCAWVSPHIGIMTHLACADDVSNAMNYTQLQQFLACVPNDCRLSVANSAAILHMQAAHLDAVRPGIMLYGVSPCAHLTAASLGLVPVMQLLSQVTALRRLAAFETIGYAATFRCTRDSLIGIVPVGYGDGYPRVIKSGTVVWVCGQYAPIVGRVSMDMLTIDLTDVANVNIGDTVELWGRNVAIEHVALSANTIAYELLCRIAPRVRQ